MPKYYFTFGFGQKHENCFHVINAPNSEKAREKMFERFGKKWAFQYDKKSWYNEDKISQQEMWNLKEIK